MQSIATDTEKNYTTVLTTTGRYPSNRRHGNSGHCWRLTVQATVSKHLKYT